MRRNFEDHQRPDGQKVVGELQDSAKLARQIGGDPGVERVQPVHREWEAPIEGGQIGQQSSRARIFPSGSRYLSGRQDASASGTAPAPPTAGGKTLETMSTLRGFVSRFIRAAGVFSETPAIAQPTSLRFLQ